MDSENNGKQSEKNKKNSHRKSADKFSSFNRNDAKMYFARLAELINGDLSSAVTTEFPPSLYNPMRYVLSSTGKRFRPILLIMSCEAVGGTARTAYEASLAIEILHNFTLVHDDIMDNDDLRRGRPTVHKKWNESIAILAGDGLIALAYRYLLMTESPRLRKIIKIFSEAIINICEGQALDKDMEDLSEVSINDYLYMIERKTGVLMGISAEIGALLGKSSRKQVEALSRFGLDLGLAFQIQDDLLDIVSEETVLGKDLGSDIAEGKKTYPILKFIENGPGKEAGYVRDILSSRNASAKDIKRIRGLLYEHKIVEQTIAEVNRRLDNAENHLLNSGETFDSANLIFLANLIRNRKY